MVDETEPGEARPAVAWVRLGLARRPSCVVRLARLPAGHNASSASGDGSIAAIGALYLIGMSVVLPRLARGWILRRAGSQEPIVLLGNGADPLVNVAIGPRWQLAAIGAGTLLSATVALGSAAVFGVADPASYTHALAGLALGTNLALVATTVMPIPGLAGWALLLSLVDAGGTSADRRARQAADIAQLIGIPGFILVGIAAALLSHPMMILIGFLLAMSVRTLTESSVGHDAIARFLGSRAAGDVARPVTSHADVDDLVDDVVGRLTDAGTVTVVEMHGALVGAIGPRQRDARDPGVGIRHCSEVMLPLARLPLLSATTPATALMPELGRHGIVLVRGSGALAYVEAGDLLRQIDRADRLGDRRASSGTGGRRRAIRSVRGRPERPIDELM